MIIQPFRGVAPLDRASFHTLSLSVAQQPREMRAVPEQPGLQDIFWRPSDVVREAGSAARQAKSDCTGFTRSAGCSHDAGCDIYEPYPTPPCKPVLNHSRLAESPTVAQWYFECTNYFFAPDFARPAKIICAHLANRGTGRVPNEKGAVLLSTPPLPIRD